MPKDPPPDDALSIVTDAALEYASELDDRGDDHSASLAMEIRESVAEIDQT